MNHKIDLKKCEKKDKYLDLARELKMLWNMKVTIVPIVIGALDTITKGLLKGLHRWERPQSWDEFWRPDETCCHSDSREKPSANTDEKNSKEVNNSTNNKMSILFQSCTFNDSYSAWT